MPAVIEGVVQRIKTSSGLRFLLLVVLSQKPATGYEIGKLLRTKLRHVWTARLQQIYAELARMRGAGLITVVEQSPHGVSGRKMCALTTKGQHELLAAVAGQQRPRRYRDDLLAKLLLLPHVSIESVVACVKDRREQAEHEVEELRMRSLQVNQTPEELGYRLTIEARLAVAEAEVIWCRRAIEQLLAATESDASSPSLLPVDATPTSSEEAPRSLPALRGRRT